jgi:hypothetical protein
VSWDRGVLQSADQVVGPWSDLINAVSPLPVDPTDRSKFYWVKIE